MTGWFKAPVGADEAPPWVSRSSVDLRDWLAGQALAGRAGEFTHPKDAARHAYAVADAMLAARKDNAP